MSDARGLSDAELAALTAYVRAGGAAIVTGPVAVRGAGGEWRGTSAMARLLGVPRITALPREASRALAAVRRGPLSAAGSTTPGGDFARLAAATFAWAARESYAEVIAAGSAAREAAPPPAGRTRVGSRRRAAPHGPSADTWSGSRTGAAVPRAISSCACT